MVLGSSKLLASGILAVSIAGVSACVPRGATEDRKIPPEVRLEGVRFHLFRGDAPAAKGTAAVVTYQRDTTALRTSDLALHLRDRGEEVTLTAPEGSGVVVERTFEATGGLLALRGTDRAATESARFDPTVGTKGLVIGDAPVELSGRGYRMRGAGFTLDPAEREIALRGGTRLVAGLPEGK